MKWILINITRNNQYLVENEVIIDISFLLLIVEKQIQIIKLPDLVELKYPIEIECTNEPVKIL